MQQGLEKYGFPPPKNHDLAQKSRKKQNNEVKSKMRISKNLLMKNLQEDIREMEEAEKFKTTLIGVEAMEGSQNLTLYLLKGDEQRKKVVKQKDITTLAQCLGDETDNWQNAEITWQVKTFVSEDNPEPIKYAEVLLAQPEQAVKEETI